MYLSLCEFHHKNIASMVTNLCDNEVDLSLI